MQLQAREVSEEEIATRRTSPSPSSSNSNEEDMANCLILLARGSSNPTYDSHRCKTCNKSFPSFQALGGHRASHKKPNKPPSDRKTLEFQSKDPDDSSIANKSRVHECAICGAKFASGQALGGHMRRHRPISIPIPILIPNATCEDDHESRETKRSRNDNFTLDLNLPAPNDDDDCAESNKFPFVQKEQAMIFSLSPLVDCHY